MSNVSRFDLVIQGAAVFDGSGASAVRADIGIVQDRIVSVEELSKAEATKRIDATGLHAAPGFIDIHTHSDISVNYDPGQASAIAMGVTTQVVGNCGLSIGLANSSPVFEFEKRWLAPHGTRIRWKSFAEHLDLVEQGGVATNYLPLVGHGTLRKRVMELKTAPPSADEMASMQQLLSEALEAGAWGFTTGLEYPPSSFAGEDELVELCKVVRKYGGFYATHLRNEGDTLIEAVQEALNVSERAGLPLQLSHHKAEGLPNWGKVNATLEMVDKARASGHDVQLDQYPYTAFMTGLSIQLLPRWALSGSNEEMAALLIDPVKQAGIIKEILEMHPEWDDNSEKSPWSNIQIGVCRGKPETQGRTIAELATEVGKPALAYALDLIAETGGYVSAVNFAIGEKDIATVMQYPWTSIGSDGVGTHPGGIASADKVHPRAYGTFPRVLGRYVRELNVITEAAAIHKMTGLPANRLGLTNRGTIKPGCFADITIYDPKTIGDVATFDDPHQFAIGIDTVIVNGQVAYESGKPNSNLAGRVLRR